MKLTLLSDYSLRVLMHLAINQGALVTIAQTADRYNISKNHLMKVAHQLGQQGHIETVRGRSGGLRLAKSPQDIILGHVIREMEQNTVVFFDYLDKFTLADLVVYNSSLEHLLLETA